MAFAKHPFFSCLTTRNFSRQTFTSKGCTSSVKDQTSLLPFTITSLKQSWAFVTSASFSSLLSLQSKTTLSSLLSTNMSKRLEIALASSQTKTFCSAHLTWPLQIFFLAGHLLPVDLHSGHPQVGLPRQSGHPDPQSHRLHWRISSWVHFQSQCWLYSVKPESASFCRGSGSCREGSDTSAPTHRHLLCMSPVTLPLSQKQLRLFRKFFERHRHTDNTCMFLARPCLLVLSCTVRSRGRAGLKAMRHGGERGR